MVSLLIERTFGCSLTTAFLTSGFHRTFDRLQFAILSHTSFSRLDWSVWPWNLSWVIFLFFSLHFDIALFINFHLALLVPSLVAVQLHSSAVEALVSLNKSDSSPKTGRNNLPSLEGVPLPGQNLKSPSSESVQLPEWDVGSPPSDEKNQWRRHNKK